MLGLVLLSCALLFTDYFTDYLDGLRSTLNAVVTPVIYVSNIPGRTVRGLEEIVESRSDLRDRLLELEQERLILQAQSFQMASLVAENNRLRELLGSAAKLRDHVLVSELVGVNPDPGKDEILVDKGSADRVRVGQPVLDAYGLIGQVIEVSPKASRVMLITDDRHLLPVQVNRSNLRLVARGTGVSGQLELQHVQPTADIKVGDLLVSSGLGGRFPVGYPVAYVSELDHDPGRPFVETSASPSARLERSRHVLLVFSTDQLDADLSEGP